MQIVPAHPTIVASHQEMITSGWPGRRKEGREQREGEKKEKDGESVSDGGCHSTGLPWNEAYVGWRDMQLIHFAGHCSFFTSVSCTRSKILM